MLRKTVSGIIQAMVLVSILALSFNIQLVRTSPETIIVPDDYSTIHDAVRNAANGDTIYVKPGIYVENSIWIGRPVSLIGENSETTIIDGNGTLNVIDISENDVVVENFTIRNGINGILSCFQNNTMIKTNNILNTSYGIRFYDSYGNSIINNNFSGCGLAIPHDSYGNVVENNLVNDKPLIYLEDVSNYVIDNAGQVILANCNNIQLDNLDVSDATYGIDLLGTNNTEIKGNKISANMVGISLSVSSNNSIIDNNITANNYQGIYLFDFSYNNTILENNITANNRYGIYLASSSGSAIIRNTVTNNTDGIYLGSSSNNSVIENYIAHNTGDGLRFHGGVNSSIISNNVSHNDYGILLGSSSNYVLRNNSMISNRHNFGIGTSSLLSHYIHDVDTSNTVNGKPVVYLVNQVHISVDPLTFPEVGYFGAVNCANIVVKDFTLTDNREGVLFINTNDSIIWNVHSVFNALGIYLLHSNNNTIQDSNVSDEGTGYGIYLLHSNNNTIQDSNVSDKGIAIAIESSHNNTIIRNIVARSSVVSIYLDESHNNTLESNIAINGFQGLMISDSNHNIIHGNTLFNHTMGTLGLGSSNNTLVYHNNYLDPVIVVLCFDNKWDKNGEGNFWSDYTGKDLNLDLIGDTPYVLGSNNEDNYPLMVPYIDLNYDGQVSIIDVAIGAIAFGAQLNDPLYTLQADIDCNHVINILDLTMIAIWFGHTWQD